MRPFILFVNVVLLLWSSLLLADVQHYFEQIKKNPKALSAFLKAMPKGGELHYHLDGGVYAEEMLKLAASDNFCLNTSNFKLSKPQPNCPSHGVNTRRLSQNSHLYRKIIEAWSMKNFLTDTEKTIKAEKKALLAGKETYESSESGESAHDHFFNSFSKFHALVTRKQAALLATIIKQAALQNESYLEVMILPDEGHSCHFGNAPLAKQSLAKTQKKLLANPAFQKNIHFTVQQSDLLLKNAKRQLHCLQMPNQAVCNVVVKFQYYVLREQALEKLFAQALNGFVAASRSSNIVAVNLVQAEDGPIALQDYHKQMAIFGFLHRAYPKVQLSLHAGELTPQFVTPRNLGFHIEEAVKLAQAKRIGHGCSIKNEKNKPELLEFMKKNGIAVEISLTSNRLILALEGNKHPLLYYLKHQIPVVLSTDDEGTLRTNLTQEYSEAVLHYAVDYATIKNINRNSLTYSFLPGKSLWQDADKEKPIFACRHLDSFLCKQFINENKKANLQWQLEKKLSAFEKLY